MRNLVLGCLAAMLSSAPVHAQMTGMKPSSMDMKGSPRAEITKAVAIVESGSAGKIHGLVTFQKTDQGIRIEADVTGLPPGKHGFHIHEYGDCSSPDYTSAGSHFMLSGETHGAPDSPNSHLGDMGNLEADADGHAHLVLVDPHLAFSGPDSILGRSVIIHEKEDDMKTQPTGNAGARIACGTIGVAKG